jgi:hypothetical protein
MTTNKIYATPGTATLFQASSGDVTFTLADAVDLGNGQISNQWDRGTGSLPTRYKWEATIKWVATPTLGDIVRLYLYAAQKANTAVDLTGDGDVTPETKFGNFALIGQVICTVAADQAFNSSGVIEIYGRYVNLGVWNASATKDLNATANACSITLTPMPDDVQAAA